MNATVQKPFMPPGRNALAAEWRRNFVRASTASVLAQIQKHPDVGEILRKHWPNDRHAELILRGPVEPMKVADAAPYSDSVTRFMSLAPQSSASKLFERAVRVDLTGISQFSFPMMSNFTEAVFVEEGQPISIGEGDFAGFPIGPVRKLALIAALTNELERASADTAATIIGEVLKICVGNGLAKVLFSDDPATDISPGGLLFAVTPIPAGATMSADLSALISAIASNKIDTSSIVFICAPAQALAIALQAGPRFSYGIIEESTLEPGTVIAVAASGLVVAGTGTPEVDVCRGGTLHISAPAAPIGTPGSPASVAAQARDLYQTDSFALRCIARITWSAAPGSVAVVTGATW